MCYEAEVLSSLIGAEPNIGVQNLFFDRAPQRTLFPTAAADPSSADVATFLKDQGIDYIYADVRHPNTLVDNAVPITSIGEAQLLRVP
jgi:hypothetical protein